MNTPAIAALIRFANVAANIAVIPKRAISIAVRFYLKQDTGNGDNGCYL